MDSLLSFLLALTGITIGLVLLAHICLSWGFWISRALKLNQNQSLGITQIWLGFISISLAIDVAHLLIPINWVLSSAITIIGLIGFIKIPTMLLTGFYRNSIFIFSKRSTIVMLSVVIYIVWCLQMLSGAINYDAGMYYISSIRWLNEHPIIPGLANLFAQFGFNHTYFSFVALLNLYPLGSQYFAFGGLFLLVLTTSTLLSSNLKRTKFGWLLLLILFCGLNVSARFLASPAPDMVVGFIEIALFAYLIDIFLIKDDSKDNINKAVMVLLLAIQVTTIKLSAAMFAFTCIILVTPIFYRQLRSEGIYGCIGRLLTFSSLIFLVHIIRGYILSGYPLFPSTAFGLHQLDWIATTEDARNAARVIYDYARNEGLPPSQWQSGWKWLPYWWSQQIKLQGYWIALISCLVGINALIVGLQRSRFKDARLLWLYLPLVTSLLFWFFTAPAWRFLGVIPYLLIGLSSWLCARSLLTNISSKIGHTLGPRIFSLLMVLVGFISLYPSEIHISGWKKLPGILIDQNPDHPVAEVIIENKLTESGLNVVFVPWFQCWNAPLPCTPLFNPALHLRSFSQEKSSIRSGFSVSNIGSELKPKYQANLEQGIQFNKPGYPNFLTSVKGIGAKESWGRWSNNKSIQLEFLYPLPMRFELNFKALGFGPNADRKATINVCNQSQLILLSNEMQTFSVFFQPKEPCSLISIDVPMPISPHEINPSDVDTRKLGIGFEYLNIKTLN